MIAIVAPERSFGIAGYAHELADALNEAGIEACTSETIPSEGPAHPQLGNSTRALWLPLATGRAPLLVTVHDVVPRQRLLRRVLARPQARMLSRHRVVVHSRHGEAMLRELGCNAPIRVVPHGVTERRLGDEERATLRAKLSPEGRPILLLAGTLKRARGSVAVLQAAQRFPAATFVVMGAVGDRETQAALAHPSENVVPLPHTSTDEFYRVIGAADMLLNFRLESVGETSGPLIGAHQWGTPVAGWATGSMPEFCGEADMLFAEGTPIENAIESVLAKAPDFGRIPPGSPLVMPWPDAVAAYAEEYRALGWL